MNKKISRVTELSEMETSPSPVLFGIEVDGECFTPPAGLRQIGLLWKGNSPKEIDDLLVDTMISFTLSGVEVILEIHPEDEVNANYVTTLAGNAGVSLSIIPPEGEAGIEAWCRHLEHFVGAFLSTANFAKALYPISGYLSFLIAERMAGRDRLDPTDPYVRARFIESTQIAWVEKAKDRLRTAFITEAGGKRELNALLDQLVTGICDEAEKILLNEHQIASNL